MPQINVLRQLANDYLAQFNHHAAQGVASGIEMQTECALEVLAELAHRSGYHQLYTQICDRKNQLDMHRIISPIAVMGAAA